jgi:hypothetical protein
VRLADAITSVRRGLDEIQIVPHSNERATCAGQDDHGTSSPHGVYRATPETKFAEVAA